MKSTNAAARSKILIFTLLLAIAGTARAQRPVILAVDGLKFHDLGCDTSGAVLGPTTLCGVIYLASKLYESNPDLGYLKGTLEENCGGSCGDFVPLNAEDVTGDPALDGGPGFIWDRKISNSRTAVNALKAAIQYYGAKASEAGRPFIIVAHSWGGALTGQALAELDPLPFRVAKVVTIGTPLGGMLYSAAVLQLIPGQGFYLTPRTVSSADMWVNYWAKRDMISSPLDVPGMVVSNIQLDGDSSFDEVSRDLRDAAADMAWDGDRSVLGEDCNAMLPPASTGVWHEIYFRYSDIDLPSMQKTVMTEWMSRGIRAQISEGY